jgi:kynurenine 3-monooxygenase
MPPTSDGRYRLDRIEALHIWPRRAFMLIALPNLDRSFTCTLFLALKGTRSFESLDSDEAITSFFAREFPDAVPHLTRLLSDFRDNPVSPLGTVRCYPWRSGGFTLLVGDAAHAIVPFYGQGMNCAFEDCLIIDDLLATGLDRWEDLFVRYERQRKRDTDAIADLALNNFVEMRDRVADERFALRKRFEIELARRFPDAYTPIYSHVTFSAIPYSRARYLGETQASRLDEFLSRIERIEDVDWKKAALLVDRLSSERPNTD